MTPNDPIAYSYPSEAIPFRDRIAFFLVGIGVLILVVIALSALASRS
jgi:hypothetical protein